MTAALGAGGFRIRRPAWHRLADQPRAVRMSEIEQDCPAEGVARLTLNRPDSLNAFTYTMYAELLARLEAIRFDPAIRVVILTGAGRGFCAGHDIRSAGEPEWAAAGLGKAQTVRAVMAK